MDQKTVVYIFNPVVSLVSTTRLAGAGRMEEILGIDRIPKAMQPLLRQQVIDPKGMNPLEAIKKRVRELLLQYGTRDPILGWIISMDDRSVLMEKIQQAEQEFEPAKTKFLADYSNTCQAHLNTLRQTCIDEGIINYEAFINAVHSAQPSIKYLEKQIQFRYLAPRAIELTGEEVQVVREGVYAQSLHDIAQKAKESQGFTRMTSRRRTAEDIERKLRGLAYFEPRLGQIANELAQLLQEIPKGIPNANYQPMHILALEGAMAALSDEESIAAKAEAGTGFFPMVKEPVTESPPEPEAQLELPDAATVTSLPVKTAQYPDPFETEVTEESEQLPDSFETGVAVEKQVAGSVVW